MVNTRKPSTVPNAHTHTETQTHRNMLYMKVLIVYRPCKLECLKWRLLCLFSILFGNYFAVIATNFLQLAAAKLSLNGSQAP